MIPLGTIVVWTIFYRGPGAAETYRPSVPGFVFGLGMGLKLSCFLLLNVVLLSTTRVEELTSAFTRLGLPYRVGFTLTLAFRLVPVFVDSAATVLQAQRCAAWRRAARGRGAAPATVPVIVPVFIGALRRADQMAIALDMRGFSLPGPRRALLERPVGARDLVVLAVALAAPVTAYLVRPRAGAGRVVSRGMACLTPAGRFVRSPRNAT